MKKFAAALAAMFILTSLSAVHAGVVVDEQEVVDQGTGTPATRSRTVMIQGNRQKMITDRAQVVTDLDKGMMYLMNPTKKVYIEMPFPPKGPMAQMMAERMSALSFKQTGKHKTISGFGCDEFTGAGTMMGNQYSVTGCFSTIAPGAKDFDGFQKMMASKVKGTAMAMAGRVPDGIPMQLDTTTKMTNFSTSGMSPDQAAKIKEMLAKRPALTSKTTVTKITSKDLPDDTFAVPSDYTRQQLPQPPGGIAGAPAPSAAASPDKSGQ